VSVLLALLLHGEACMPLLGEWFLSFGIVATCLVIPGPMAGVEYWSFKFDLSWSVEASRVGNAA
jgi:hypothetical protein